MSKKRVVIIGGGPSGLFAAYKLAGHADVTVLDAGKMPAQRDCSSQQTLWCRQCNPCNVVAGFGGAGLLSSGMLNLTTNIGFPDKTVNAIGLERTRELIDEVDRIFLEHGAPLKSYDPDERFNGWEKRAAEAGLKFIVAKQRLIGTDNSTRIIESLMEWLKKKDVRIESRKRVEDIEPGMLIANNKVFEYDMCLVAPGRYGMAWLEKKMFRLGVHLHHSPVDLGVRVEVPAAVMDDICSLQRDPKIRVRTRKYDDLVRTFCVNHNGWVVREQYDTHACVNGHSFSNKESGNSNFAFLVTVQLTAPTEDTTKYARSIAEQVTLLGGGKPIVQRIADLENHRRSTTERIKNANIEPTLQDVTPGDISMVFPKRLTDNILEGLQSLNRMIPGVYSGTTLLYAPEIKYSAMTVETNDHFETSADGIYVAGDGAGLSRGIVPAAVTGLWAAEDILSKL
ncbi:MAG: FAD-dependent oxidoreductase [Candidatus Thorarchaeota archaeon]|nr:MAG: FAD-dependent oxidoreductase [Candidatus Thorarchaeota archaeon]